MTDGLLCTDYPRSGAPSKAKNRSFSDHLTSTRRALYNTSIIDNASHWLTGIANVTFPMHPKAPRKSAWPSRRKAMHILRSRRVLQGATLLSSSILALRASDVSHFLCHRSVAEMAMASSRRSNRVPYRIGDTARDNGANLVRQSILALDPIFCIEIALQDAAPATCFVKIEPGNGPTLDDAMGCSTQNYLDA